MRTEYTVKDEFLISGSKVIVLDKKREFTSFENSHILVDDKKLPYKLTHNENWLIVDTDIALKGKKIEIVS